MALLASSFYEAPSKKNIFTIDGLPVRSLVDIEPTTTYVILSDGTFSPI